MSIVKIISGGQTGADIAALRVGKYLGYEVGGWMPKEWWTQGGPKSEYEKLYNMKECQTKGYSARTYANVRDSDGTIRFALDFNSPGEICTLGAINTHKKPYLDICVKDIICRQKSNESINAIHIFIVNNNIKTLNIAGNSERTCNGIESMVSIFLTDYLINVRNVRN